MRSKYREMLEEKRAEEKLKVLSTMIENSVLNKDSQGFQPVKMVFLTEQNAADSDWRISSLEHNDENKMVTNSEEPVEDSKDEALDELKAKSI